MDYILVIGLLVALVVGFFAYQWMAKRPAARPRTSGSSLVVTPPVVEPVAEPMASGDENEKRTPTVGQQPTTSQTPIAGQTPQETRTKEPIQRREPSSTQGPVTNEGQAPAQFDQHLRHPEQLFHQSQQPAPTLHVTDGPTSTPHDGHQQGFSPEMAQNGGAFLGNSVFAFDGMEPTGFTSF